MAGGEGDRRTGSDIPEADQQRLVERGPFGYAVATRTGAVVRANSTLLEWLRLDRDELCGVRTLQSLLGPGDRIYFDTHVRPLLHMGGVARDIAVELVPSQGEPLPVLLGAELVESADGDEVVEVIFLDARSRRSYEMELLRERQNAEQARDRVRLMYRVVAGLAGAVTVDDVRAVVTAESASPFAGTRCHLWMFSHDGSTAEHVVADGDIDRYGSVHVDRHAVGAALGELAAGEVVHVALADSGADVQNASGDAAVRYPLITELLHQGGMRSAIVAPLRDETRLMGILAFTFVDLFAPDESERLAVQSLAAQSSQALRRAQLHEAQTRAREQLESLYAFGRSLSSTMTVGEVIDELTRVGHELFGADDVRVGRLHPDGIMELAGGRAGEPPVTVERHPGAHDIACVAAREPAVVSTATRAVLERDHPDSAVLADPEIRYVEAISLADEERVVGAWVLGFDVAGSADSGETTLLQLFAEEASHAIRRAIVHERETRRTQRAVVRQNISEALNRAATAEAVADALVHEGRIAFDADGLCVLVVDEGELVMIGQSGLDPDARPDARIPTSMPGVRRLLDSASPTYSAGATDVARDLDAYSFGRWGSSAVLPLRNGGRTIGMMIALYDQEAPVDIGSRRALAGIAAEASVAISRAMRFDVEHDIAVKLQRSMLPEELPRVEGWRIDSWYEPSNSYLMIGGDLYDVTLLDDGRLVVVIGDVVGHGVDAAASLGQLRSAARALSLDVDDPSGLLERLDAFSRSSRGTRGATVCCAIIEPDGRGRYACAGHPYPILVTDGHAELLGEGRSGLLGVAQGPRPDAEFLMPPGASLVLYTDGVVERHDERIDDGFDRLRRVIETVDFTSDPRPARTIGETLLGGDDHRDDAVVLTVSHAGVAALHDPTRQ